MFCREFGVKTVESQAECQAAPGVLPGFRVKNGHFPGGMPGGAGGFAGSFDKTQKRRGFCREF